MKKILLIVILVLITVAAVCLIPFSSNVSETLAAAKVDSQGNVVDTVQIPIRISKSKSLLKTQLRNIQIGAFDGLLETKQLKMSQFKRDPLQGYWSISVGIGKTDFSIPTPENPTIGDIHEESYLYMLAFSEDLERWMIRISNDTIQTVYYLGSVDSKYTTHELAEYFGVPGF